MLLGDLGTFRAVCCEGDNRGPRATQALARWEREVADKLPERNRPSRDIAVRLALVHEFSTHSRVFISTEAGAKGLNLQFCDTVINYDLPWNPQRIEQRIGRCHRYGQTRGVLVINFINTDNEADRLTFDILSRKLDLFGTVLDASDAVLHEPGSRTSQALTSALGMDFERRLTEIYARARSLDEVEEELERLRDSVSDARELATKLDDARRRRDGAAGASAREFAEAVVAELESDLEDANDAVAGLRRRDDERYNAWRNKALEKRYATPRIERIIDVRFAVAGTST